METIYQTIRTAQKYNQRINEIVYEHRDDGSIYWCFIPVILDDCIAPEYAKTFLMDCQNYDEAVDNYRYFLRQQINEIIASLTEVHAPEDLGHMNENIAGTKALLEYLQVIDEFWHDL